MDAQQRKLLRQYRLTGDIDDAVAAIKALFRTGALNSEVIKEGLPVEIVYALHQDLPSDYFIRLIAAFGEHLYEMEFIEKDYSVFSMIVNLDDNREFFRYIWSPPISASRGIEKYHIIYDYNPNFPRKEYIIALAELDGNIVKDKNLTESLNADLESIGDLHA